MAASTVTVVTTMALCLVGGPCGPCPTGVSNSTTGGGTGNSTGGGNTTPPSPQPQPYQLHNGVASKAKCLDINNGSFAAGTSVQL